LRVNCSNGDKPQDHRESEQALHRVLLLLDISDAWSTPALKMQTHPDRPRSTRGRRAATRCFSSLPEIAAERYQDRRLCARSHAPNAITSAPAIENQVMAYCM
jgi:hypothetical protein